MNNNLSKKVTNNGQEFLTVFYNNEWCYIAKEISDYFEYSDTSAALKHVNKEDKYTITKKKDSDIFDVIFNYLNKVGSYMESSENSEGSSMESSENSEKIVKYAIINETGLLDIGMHSQKPNAKLMVKEMINVFRVELDKAGISALEYLLQLDKDSNTLTNSKINKLINMGATKHNIAVINSAINELLYYEIFPEPNTWAKYINTDYLRTNCNNIELERRKISDELLNTIEFYFKFNNKQIGLRKAKTMVATNLNFNQKIIDMFNNR